MATKKIKSKSEEFQSYLGDLVTIFLKNPIIVGNAETGESKMLPFIEGYVIDYTEHFVRLGETPEEFTLSVDINDITIVRLSDGENILSEVGPVGEDVH